MKKILSLVSFLLLISTSFLQPAFAASHEKKAENADQMTATEQSAEQTEEKKKKPEADSADDSSEPKKQEGAEEEEEEPDCE